jgi:hypothetical protein
MTEPTITVMIVMQPLLNYIFDSLKNIRLQLLIGVLCFFVIALVLSTIPGDVYLLLWLVVGAFTLYFIRLTFPDVWNYTFWLIGIFCLNFIALICLLDTKFTSHWLFFGFGVFFEFLALAIDILFILRIKAIRDDISGVTERPSGMELQHEAMYIPLGVWSLFVFLFWFISNLSIFYWYNWSVLAWGPEPYLASQIILIIIMVYILWHPQMKFEWEVEPVLLPLRTTPGTGSAEGKAAGLIPGLRKTVRVSSRLPKNCPICGAKIVLENRQCSNCGQKKTFSWCKISEGYIVTCPHCKTQTSYGKKGCINCGQPINRTIKCSCGTENEIRDWKFLRISG